MTCDICGKPKWHGSQEPGATQGSHLSETGCHDGVMMDDDEHAEGWQSDVIYPPCPNHPNRCPTCGGSGEYDGGDCETCDGTGWYGCAPQYPINDTTPHVWNNGLKDM